MTYSRILADASSAPQTKNLGRSLSRRRLLRGFAAAAVAPVTGTLIQVISVPIFLHCWGAEMYGEWLVLIAVPTYLLLSDMGFGNAAGNEMTMQVAGGNRSSALAVFQSSRLLVTLISVAIASVAMLVLWFAPIPAWLRLTHISSQDAHLILALLVGQVLIHLQNNLTVVAFRCEGQFAFGTCCLNFASLAEGAAVTGIVLAGGPPLHAALTCCLTKVASGIILMILLRWRIEWIRLGFSKARLGTARELTSPAFAFMAFPLGGAINMQGMVLVIGMLANPVDVVVFSTLRTFTRLAIQSVGPVSNTVWPELSIAFGSGRLAHARQLHRRACQFTLWISLITVVGLAIVGPLVYPIWVNGRIPMDHTAFYILLLVVVANSFWSTSAMASVACNAHQRIAVVYTIGALASVALSVVLMPYLGVNAPVLSLLAMDILMILVVVQNSICLLGDSVLKLWRSTISIPPFISIARSFVEEVRLLGT